jgi:hypothetical protein
MRGKKQSQIPRWGRLLLVRAKELGSQTVREKAIEALPLARGKRRSSSTGKHPEKLWALLTSFPV